MTTSLLIAENFNKSHAHVLRDIENLDCSKEFRESNFGLSSYNSEQNKSLPMYLITKDGFMFLVMGYRGKKASKIKENYIKAFNIMLDLLREKKDPRWLKMRQQGIITRKAETDAIKSLVEYAKGNGSKNADKYYVLYTKLANKFAGLDTKRDDASILQLSNLSLGEHIIHNVILDGLTEGKDYHDIYKECKKRLDIVSELAFITDYGIEDGQKELTYSA